MTTEEARDFIQILLKGMNDKNSYVIVTDSGKLKAALFQALLVMDRARCNVIEKSFRNPSDAPNKEDGATISDEGLNGLNRRFSKIEELLKIQGKTIIRIKEILEDKGLWED